MVKFKRGMSINHWCDNGKRAMILFYGYKPNINLDHSILSTEMTGFGVLCFRVSVTLDFTEYRLQLRVTTSCLERYHNLYSDRMSLLLMPQHQTTHINPISTYKKK